MQQILADMEYVKRKRKTKATGIDSDRYIEYQKSRLRSKAEYTFLIIKRLLKI